MINQNQISNMKYFPHLSNMNNNHENVELNIVYQVLLTKIHIHMYENQQFVIIIIV